MTAEGFAETELTRDALLGGRVMLRQPAKGFRAATDAVLLAATAPAAPGWKTLDIGCGAGAALLCLAARVPGLELHGLELQPAYAALARRNAAEAGLAAEIAEGDVFAPPAELRRTGFDLVLSNPPWFETASPAAPDGGRDAARRAIRGAGDWAAACLARVRSGGRLVLILPAAALPEALGGLGGAGDIAALPLAARVGRPAKRVILAARKGAKAPFRLLAPFILHYGPAHDGDRDKFTPAAERVLRGGAALPMS